MRRILIVLTAVALAVGGATAALADPHGGRLLMTTLTPEAEIAPFEGVEGATGEVSLRLNPGLGQVCVEMTTNGFDLVLAHIHEGVAGTNGGVVVDFSELIDGDDASGCVSADRSVIVDIIRNPAGFYVNIHQGFPPTDEFFQSIRGQLSR
jgi:hypothetical protein